MIRSGDGTPAAPTPAAITKIEAAIAPTVAAKMSNTLDQLSRGRVIINVVTGGFPHEQAADGDFMEHDERYAMADEYCRLCYRLWEDSWADDAVIKDRARDMKAGNGAAPTWPSPPTE